MQYLYFTISTPTVITVKYFYTSHNNDILEPGEKTKTVTQTSTSPVKTLKYQ
jgi:hypothetical protein